MRFLWLFILMAMGDATSGGPDQGALSTGMQNQGAAHQAPAGLSGHEAWDALLRRYVREDHRVDYGRWKQDGTESLDAYLAGLAAPSPASTTAAARQAALTNAYNALTIRWILNHYPVKSIWKTKQPFTGKRHRVFGGLRSLDDIETELRKTMGSRAHAVLVCAARSCPPLRREAYVAERLDAQLEDNTRAWLANPRLNQFDAAKGVARVSSIFKWYRQDFDAKWGTLEGFLARYAPQGALGANPSGRKLQVRFLDYDWGLNDTGSAGDNYRGFYLDYLRNK